MQPGEQPTCISRHRSRGVSIKQKKCEQRRHAEWRVDVGVNPADPPWGLAAFWGAAGGRIGGCVRSALPSLREFVAKPASNRRWRYVIVAE